MIKCIASVLCFILILIGSLYSALIPLSFGYSDVMIMLSLLVLSGGICLGGWVSGLVFNALKD